MKSLAPEKIKQLQRCLGYQFNKPELLEAALTHRSVGLKNNERLEFLGDALLNFIIGAELFARFLEATEGELTRMRARLVRGETLAIIARDLKLGDYLHLGLGELKSGGHQRESILADAMEAIIGAIYLDSNIEKCRDALLKWYDQHLDLIAAQSSVKDAKTLLQEHLQARKLPLPEYRVVEIKGEPHDQKFFIECRTDLLAKPVIGSANSRRKAEQFAAEKTLELLKGE